jgi:hypothetical protein
MQITRVLTTSVKSGSFPRNKKLSQAQPAAPRVQIGIEELKGTTMFMEGQTRHKCSGKLQRK